MTCKQIQSQLSAYIDGDLSTIEKEQVEAHLADCPVCHKELADLKETVALLQSTPQMTASEKFLQQVNAQIDVQQSASPIWKRVRRFPSLLFKIKIPMQLAAATAMAVLVIMMVTSPEMKRVSETTLQKYAEIETVAPPTGHDAEVADIPAASSEELSAGSRMEECIAADYIARYSTPPSFDTVGTATLAEGVTGKRQPLAANAPASKKNMEQAATIQKVSEPMAMAEATIAPKIAEPYLITLIPHQEEEAVSAPQVLAAGRETTDEMASKEVLPSEEAAYPLEASFGKKQLDDLMERTKQEVISLVTAAGGKLVTDSADETIEKTVQIAEGKVAATISAVIPTESYAEFFRQLETLGRCESGTASDLTNTGGNIKIIIKRVDPPGSCNRQENF